MTKTTSKNDKKTTSEKANDKKNVVIRTAIKAGIGIEVRTPVLHAR